MSTISRVSYWLKKGRRDDALAFARQHRVVVSGSVETGESGLVRLLGTVLHVSKGKKLSIAKSTTGDKKQRRDVNYFRLVFCRLVYIHILNYLCSLLQALARMR